MKEKLKKILWFFANPRLWICIGLAWMITNGWSYVMLGLGTLFNIGWMQIVAGGYLALLWVPATPEKILTMILAIFFLKRLFPKDTKTLAVLDELYAKAKAGARRRRSKRREKDSSEDDPTA